MTDRSFKGESKYPVPDTRDVMYDHDPPLKLLLANRGTANNAFGTMKQKVEQFRIKFKLNAPMVRTVPQEIATLHGDNTSVDSKLVDKNENIMSFLQIFFSRPQYDRSGSIAALLPTELTVEALELLSSHSSTSDQAT